MVDWVAVVLPIIGFNESLASFVVKLIIESIRTVVVFEVLGTELEFDVPGVIGNDTGVVLVVETAGTEAATVVAALFTACWIED